MFAEDLGPLNDRFQVWKYYLATRLEHWCDTQIEGILDFMKMSQLPNFV